MIAVGRVALMRHFKNVEAELRFGVSEGILLVPDGVTVLFLKFGIEHGHGAIRSETMAIIVRGIMSERADSESVLVQIFRVAKQSLHKISAPHIVSKVAEKMASVRVIAHVLDDRPAIGVGLRFAQLLFGGTRKTGQQQRLDVRLPQGIDDRLVRKNRESSG